MARIHTKKDLVTSIILAVSVVMISVSMDHYIGEFLKKYYYLFGAVAVLIFIFKGVITQKLQNGTIAHLVADVFAVIFLFLFIKEILLMYIDNSLSYLFIGIFLYTFYPLLVKQLVPEG